MRLPLALILPVEHEARKLSDLLEGEKGSLHAKVPLVGLPPNEEVMQLFQKEIDRRNLTWPVAVEVDSLDGVLQFVRCGFGAGITVRIPGVEIPEGMRVIDLENFPPLVIGIVYQGGLKPVAKTFLDAARERAEKIVSAAHGK